MSFQDLINDLWGKVNDEVCEDHIEENEFIDKLPELLINPFGKSKRYNQCTPELIILRYGLNDNKKHTLKEIAYKFETNQNRIRILLTRSLRILRHNQQSKFIRFGGNYDFKETNKNKLSTRTRNALRMFLPEWSYEDADPPKNIFADIAVSDLLSCPNIGHKAIKEIIDWLSEDGFELRNMNNVIAKNNENSKLQIDRAIKLLESHGYKIQKPDNLDM
jgi:hypothetical protein